MSKENFEMLTALLGNIYANWLDKVSSMIGAVPLYNLTGLLITKLITGILIFIYFYVGKKREEVEKFVNEGVYQMERLKEEGWITNIEYEDEVEIIVINRDMDTLFRFDIRWSLNVGAMLYSLGDKHRSLNIWPLRTSCPASAGMNFFGHCRCTFPRLMPQMSNDIAYFEKVKC